ncbi:MAG: SDR family NAD(P)-dependent oxidoreductase [Halofilum sp. (in: g-proteobacteria)]|nr:SDR family NAD(P)-dependent oxidoreductase [Halofilum sp. (in: g-proteobacteria)]
MLAARSRGRLDDLVAELGGGERALAVQCDVTDADDQAAMARAALDTFGRIDVVFANAGRGGSPGGFGGADPAVWRDMILTNVYGVGLTLHHTLAALRERRGHLVLMGSAAGRGTIAGSMYGATKWAVTGIGYNVREELRGSGVRVTLLEPGMVDTPFFDEPPKQAMQPGDIAAAVIYAVSQPERVDVNEILVRPTPPLDEQ